MGGRRTRGPFSYHNIPIGHNQQEVAPFSANRRKIVPEITLNHFFLSTNLKEFFLNNSLEFLIKIILFITCHTTPCGLLNATDHLVDCDGPPVVREHNALRNSGIYTGRIVK
jgi:hypothetical protein